jgi:hypothetical protein
LSLEKNEVSQKAHKDLSKMKCASTSFTTRTIPSLGYTTHLSRFFVTNIDQEFPIRPNWLERPDTGIEKEWFKENSKLKEKLKDKIHFVFLEGYAGSGKNDILNRLQRIGYTVAKHPFLPVAQVILSSKYLLLLVI